MSEKAFFDWRRHKRDWDYEKYGGRLDPDEDVFFGPVTVRELKKSVEVAELIVKKAREKKKATLEAAKNKLDNKDESEMNRTFEVDENSVNHTLNTTFEINDTPSKSVQNAVREPLKDISGINTILLDNLELDEISHNLSSISVKSIQNTSINKNQCLIDKTFPEFVDTYLPTPLIDKIPKAVNKTPKKDNSCRDNSITNTPRVTKMSDTFITDMLAEDVLLDSPVKKTAENVADKLAHKQEISVSKCSEIRQKDSSNFQKSIFRNSFISKVPKYKETPDKHRCFFSKSPTYNHADSSYKSKLPKIKKTPVKFKHFIRSPVNSPVSDYIHLGKKIQSSSEARHSKCLKNQLQEKSKTDRKGSKQSSMIPQSTLGAAKRKLDLEAKSVTSTTFMKTK